MARALTYKAGLGGRKPHVEPETNRHFVELWNPSAGGTVQKNAVQ